MSQNINSEVFVSLLEALSSTDNAARSDADARINTLKKHDINGILRLTLNVMLTEPNDERRLQSIVLVRILLDLSKSGDAPKTTWKSVTPDVKVLLKSSLLKSLESETQKLIRKNVCNTIADLCASSLEFDEWPDLSTITLRLVQNDNPVYKKSGLKLFGDCFNYFVDDLAEHVDSVAQLIKASLMNPDVSVRTEALCAVSTAIEYDVIDLTSRLVDTVPLMLEHLRQLLSSPDPTSRDELERSLAGMIVAVDNNAKILKRHVQLFFTRMMELALGEGPAQNLEQDLRCMSLETLVTMAEKKPKMALSIPNFGIRMVNCLMTCMLDIQDDCYSEWLETGEDDNVNRRLYDVGEEGLDRLGRALENIDNCPLMDWVLSTASQYIQSPHWHHKFVGIMAISQTVEFLTDDEVEDRMPSIIKIMLEKLKDPDYRIRFAVCQTIGQLALDHQPYVQLNFHEEVLPELIATFDDVAPRVQSHALSAFINFAEEVQKDHLLPFADVVVQRILSKINMHTTRAVREQAVTSIAVIAGVLEEHFIKYYTTIIPLMKEIISKCVTPEERTCRGKAIECISIIGMSIGKDVFLNDGIECMNALIQILEQPSEPDDPVREYVGEALGRLCTALGPNFVPFLPKIVPNLLNELTKSSQSYDEDQDMTVSMGKEGAAGLKTSMVDDLERTLNLICTIVEELKELYEDYIPSTAQAVLPVLSYLLTSELKDRALTAMANMIEAKKLALEKRGGSRDMLLELVLNTMNTVLTDLENSRDLSSGYDIPAEILSAEAKGLNRCLNCAGPGILNTNVLTVVSTKLLQIIENSSKMKALYRKCREDKSLDQDEVLALEEDEEDEQSFRSSLLDMFGVIMKHHPEEFMASCQPMCLKFVCANLEKPLVDDVAIALCLCDDMIEHLGQRVVPFWDNFLPHILKHVESREASLRQSACYGVCQLAKIPEFSYLVNDTAAKLAAVLKIKFPASAKDQQTANDNAVAALGDLIRYQGPNLVDGNNYLNLWLKSLPLKHDEAEGRRVHKELMELVLNNNPTILGPDNSNLAQLVKIFISIYETDVSTEEINKQIINLMKHLGQDFLKQLAPSLSKKLQMQLKIIAKSM